MKNQLPKPVAAHVFPATTTLPQTGFVRLPQILAVFPVGRSTWWNGVKSKKYPQPVKISPRCTAWKAEDIRALIENQTA
ncbi:MAG: AlpA family phage regulatory protein [Nitrosomonadales bacterium]|nr:AlpA family phage regulatory protein [Nitrosomonadales bacterium]